ncbi:MAG: hypothetical protein V3T77_04500 [Planctomycetota bacterium]
MAPAMTLEKRLRKWRMARADLRLFRHLSRVHRLATDEVELLLALADQHCLVRASEIFLRPGLFSGTPDGQRWRSSQVRELGRRLTRTL